MEIDLQNNVVDKTMTNEEQDKQVQQSQNYITFKDLEQVSLRLIDAQNQKPFRILSKVQHNEALDQYFFLHECSSSRQTLERTFSHLFRIEIFD